MSDGGAIALRARVARLIGFFVVGAVGLYGLYVALTLGLWRGSSPGEGLFPFISSVSMIAFSALGIVVVLAAPRDNAAVQDEEGRQKFWRMGAYVVALLFYALTLESLGFIAATIISVAAILRFAERYSWLSSLAIAIGAAAACHVVFGIWLGTMLPAGTLWERFTG